MTRLARTAVIASMLIGRSPLGTAAGQTDVVLASGTMEGRFLAESLFHIGEFWMKVQADTEFHRWLTQGIDRTVVITLTSNPERFGDDRKVRILTGTLMHVTAPNPTPITTDVVGRLPEGDSGLVHVLFLKDELSGSLGAVTFQTADKKTVAKFDPYDNRHVSIVIQMK